MQQVRTPKFRAPVIRQADHANAAPPRSEADVIRRSAESSGRGKQGGRPAGQEPSEKVGLTLAVRQVAALDKLAAERFGNNRSMAMRAILDGEAVL